MMFKSLTQAVNTPIARFETFYYYNNNYYYYYYYYYYHYYFFYSGYKPLGILAPSFVNKHSPPKTKKKKTLIKK